VAPDVAGIDRRGRLTVDPKHGRCLRIAEAATDCANVKAGGNARISLS